MKIGKPKGSLQKKKKFDKCQTCSEPSPSFLEACNVKKTFSAGIGRKVLVGPRCSKLLLEVDFGNYGQVMALGRREEK